MMELHAFEQMATASDKDKGSDFCFAEAGLQPQPDTVFPDVTPPGMAYVPYQIWDDDNYDPETGIHQGTLFPVLDLPFACGRK